MSAGIGIACGPGDAQIVCSTIDLAHNLGLGVLAGDEAQGDHTSRPLPVDDFLAWHAQQA